jgi:AraC-like DNA-binding protein
MNHSSRQTTIYIGLNDSETRVQKFDSQRYISILKGACRSYKVAFSVQEINGGYFHEDGRYTEENTLMLTLIEAALSPFYYQRIFGALCGMTVGEYIRARRMTLAAQELSGTDGKVIDVALKYGYDSPDSFAKAFQRFHGISPSKAREPGAHLRSLASLHIKISLEGGKMLDYRIVEMQSAVSGRR